MADRALDAETRRGQNESDAHLRHLLLRCKQGDRGAFDDLIRLFEELRRNGHTDCPSSADVEDH